MAPIPRKVLYIVSVKSGREVPQVLQAHLVRLHSNNLIPEAAIILVTADQNRTGSGDQLDVVMPGDEAVERS